MLCQFTFKNFKSYKDETTLDFQAVSKDNFQDSLLFSSLDTKPFLPVTVIYGPNAGGKSNILKALNCVCTIVLKPITMLINSPVHETWKVECTPFMFDDVSRNIPTEFELFFRPDDTYEYRYRISIFENRIIEESLYMKKIGAKGRASKLFERFSEKIILGSSFIKADINTNVNDRMPYLSFLAVNYKLDFIENAVGWFEKCSMKNYANPFSEARLFMRQDIEFKKKIISFMNQVGICVDDFQIVEDNNKIDIIFQHKIEGKSFPLRLTQESDGTQKLFNVLPLVLMALSEGKLLVFDELDAKLHPKLLVFLIKLFKDKEINCHNAQLVFTSHDVSSMRSSVFRTDEIWFACKKSDESSDLYSLCELRDENDNHITSDVPFDKQYLEGRYGADPYFQNMMNWR